MMAKMVITRGLLWSQIYLLLLAVPILLRADGAFMGVEELEPGMRGIGRTVFSGTRVEDFQVEILGVLKNVWPRGDMILARIEGGPLPLEETGVISGMSGSPIYIEGRLIGALAFGWPFARQAMVGITPIRDMLSVWDSAGDIKAEKPSRTWNQPLMAESNRGPLTLRSLPSPLTFSGFDPWVIKEIEPILNRLGFLVAQGGGGAALEGKDISLIPGSAVGICFIRGDLSATAVGTLTYQRGDKILAFGHPLLFGGPTDLPLSGAYIHTVMPSLAISFKLGSATQIVGRVSQDRRAAVAGEVGIFAQTIPFEVRIRGREEEVYRFEIINSRVLTPLFFRAAVSSAILTAARRVGETSFSYSLSIYLRGKEPITIANSHSHPASVLQSVQELTKPLALLMENPFQEVEVEKVSLEVDIKETRKMAEILGLRLNKNKVRPGESLEIIIILRPFEEAPILKTVQLTVPKNTPEGELRITISDALSARQKEKKRAPHKLRPGDLNRLIKLMEGQDRNTEVIIRLILPRRGMVIAGVELPALPGSVLAVMGVSPEVGLGGVTATKATNLIEKKLSTDWVISPGSFSLPLMVESRF